MLKIVRSIEGGSAVFALSGRIEAQAARDLEASFAGEAHPIVVDFDEARLVDREAVPLLAAWRRRGIELRNCPGYVREWMAREEGE